MLDKLPAVQSLFASKSTISNDVVNPAINPAVTLNQAVQVNKEEQPRLSKAQMEQIVKEMNLTVSKSQHTHLSFEYHEKLNEYFVKIVDNRTNEVVKEIPSEKMLDSYASMLEFAGLLFEEKK